MGRLTSQEEEALIRQAQQGSLSAFDRLVQSVRPALMTLALTKARRDEADDAVQETLISAFKFLPRLESPEKLRPWLAAILRNNLARLGRKQETASPLDELILAYAPSIQQGLILSEQACQLVKAIGQMEPEIRLVMELHYGQEWSAPEISQLTGIPVTTVKWRLHTGRTLLKKRFGHDYEN